VLEYVNPMDKYPHFFLFRMKSEQNKKKFDLLISKYVFKRASNVVFTNIFGFM
jgi:hypothetical protein